MVCKCHLLKYFQCLKTLRKIIGSYNNNVLNFCLRLPDFRIRKVMLQLRKIKKVCLINKIMFIFTSTQKELHDLKISSAHVAFTLLEGL